MSRPNPFKKAVYKILKKYLAASQEEVSLNSPVNFLVVRQHNQFGDLLASVSLFRAIKETYPNSKITLIASRENYFAVEKNEFVDHLFVFDKRKILNPDYFTKISEVLKYQYDVAIVPATVAVSQTSCILAALSNSKIKIGPKSLNGVDNPISFVFNKPVDLNWKKSPDAHVSDFILDVVRPYGIKTRNYSSSIKFDNEDESSACEFLQSLDIKDDELVIGFHIGAGKPQNRWPLEKFIKLIYLLGNEYKIKIYFTGSSADRAEINFIQSNLNIDAGYFLNKTIPQLAALISASHLFITNDTGVMHVAGTAKTPQISIFGPTNPFNWAPIGPGKYFLRKSELVGDVEEEEVFNLCKYIFAKRT